jgi:hypothetical protein
MRAAIARLAILDATDRADQLRDRTPIAELERALLDGDAVLAGVRGGQCDDEKECEGNQQVEGATRDDARNFRRCRRGPDFLQQPDCRGPS